MPESIGVVVIAVGALIAFLIYKAVLSARETREERTRGLRALGLEPLAALPPEVAEPILALHRHGKHSRHRTDNVYERRGSADRLYLLDLKDTSGDSTHDEVIAVFSPRLRVPRLTLFPRLEGKGRLVALGNALLKKLGQHHGGVVDFARHPRFARRHFVSGPDEGAIRHFLTDRRLDSLAQMGHMGVEAEGAHFTYRDLPFGRRKTGSREDTSHRVAQAEQLLRALEGQ